MNQSLDASLAGPTTRSGVKTAQNAIITWFVSDEANEATFLPQVQSLSHTPKTKITYWRCAVVFFASSLAVNPDARHVFFTNCDLPVIEGIDLASLFSCWGVEVVRLPITFRLECGAVSAWGNQFYVFDIIAYLAANALAEQAIILDSDCIWLKPIDEMADAIATSGCIGYFLGEDEHPGDEAINGLSRAGMARFLATHGGPLRGTTPYYGGEIYAARQDITCRIADRFAMLWPLVLGHVSDAPREEAHLLSILYALDGIENCEGNRFIRRMWTTF